MLNGPAGLSLRGRHNEREALDRVVDVVRSGQSAALVVRGEAGIGKTRLLDYLVERAAGCRIARAAGVESEMEVAFAGLHQLCAPFLDRRECLPDPHCDALSTALGLSAGQQTERLLLGFAVLGLLSEVAEEEPLICVVDDVQWLDWASAQTLAFVARRLRAESVGLVFAVREPAQGQELMGLPELLLSGLPYSDARALLESAIHGRLDERVRDRIVAETRGNPLALLELPRGLTPAELAGGFGLPDRTPLASRIEQSFRRRIRELPRATQRLLLAAAAEPVGDAALLWRAAQQLGIGADAAAPAETAGLIELGARVRFPHPLVRSAAYRGAAVTELREVHRALAQASDPETDPDRRAWHRAHAAVVPDEAVADELARSAELVQRRGGVAAAAAFLKRATELTPDPARRGARALAAAQAMFDAGATDSALELLATAELSSLDELQCARLGRLRARLTCAPSRGLDAPRLLLDAARQLQELDPHSAREAYLEALVAADFAGQLGERQEVRKVAEAARIAPPGPEPPRAIDLLLDGLAVRFTEGYIAAVPLLSRAIAALKQEGQPRYEDLRWLRLASVAHELFDDAAWDQLTDRALNLARDTGTLASLPLVLTFRAGYEIYAGRLAEASARVEEATAISEITGIPAPPHAAMVIAAWRGQDAQALDLIDSSTKDAAARGEGRVISVAEYARAVLYNGEGRYDVALAAAQRVDQHDDLGLVSWNLLELIEASARIGSLDVARHGLERLEERTTAVANGWARGVHAQSLALLSEGHEADVLYREAIERLARTRMRVLHSRAQLLYGEWLRREGRRLDARKRLRVAHDTFSRMGADGFAERARRELIATGERVRRRDVATRDDLTAQETQIARLARDGYTNLEIGGQLFLSPRTVEWHLSKVFGKLGIGSRRELRDALRKDEQPAWAA